MMEMFNATNLTRLAGVMPGTDTVDGASPTQALIPVPSPTRRRPCMMHAALTVEATTPLRL